MKESARMNCRAKQLQWANFAFHADGPADAVPPVYSIR
jgi:hypothetical protein